jgi:hypothetical protein
LAILSLTGDGGDITGQIRIVGAYETDYLNKRSTGGA